MNANEIILNCYSFIVRIINRLQAELNKFKRVKFKKSENLQKTVDKIWN